MNAALPLHNVLILLTFSMCSFLFYKYFSLYLCCIYVWYNIVGFTLFIIWLLVLYLPGTTVNECWSELLSPDQIKVSIYTLLFVKITKGTKENEFNLTKLVWPLSLLLFAKLVRSLVCIWSQSVGHLWMVCSHSAACGNWFHMWPYLFEHICRSKCWNQCKGHLLQTVKPLW